MKILFASYYYWPPHFGGELKISIERFESLVQRGHKVTVLTSGIPGLPEREIVDGIEILRSPRIHDSRFGRGIRRLVFPIWASAQMRKMKFDILHHGGTGGITPLDNFFGMTLLNRCANKKGAAKVIVHSLADTETEVLVTQGFGSRLRNKNLGQMDCIVSVSPALHTGVARVFPEKAKMILNAVKDGVFKPLKKEKRRNFRQSNGIIEEQVVFSFLGTVSQRKGFDLLVPVFISLLMDNPSYRLWVIGPVSKVENQNVDEIAIERLISNSKDHSKGIKYWGRIDNRDELTTILASSDVFVFPSRKEGMPLAPMEAMSAGVPVIISRIPGVTDQASIEGVTGRYIQVNDADELRNAMIELGSDPELRERMGQAARQRIEQEFGWEKHIDEWEALYTSLYNHRV